jgi:hypothetical protein
MKLGGEKMPCKVVILQYGGKASLLEDMSSI